jgi:hypothetical protein
MQGFQTDDSAAADRELNESLNETAPDDGQAKFLARVDEYRQESLDREDARTACLGKLNADLMEMLHHTGKEINGVFDSGTRPLELPHIESALRTHLSLGHQLRHLQNLEARFEELRHQAEQARRPAPPRGSKFRPH